MTNPAKEIPFKVPPVIKVIEYAGTPEQAFIRFTAESAVCGGRSQLTQ